MVGRDTFLVLDVFFDLEDSAAKWEIERYNLACECLDGDIGRPVGTSSVERRRRNVHGRHFDLDAALCLVPGNLRLNRVATAKWHRDELSHGSVSIGNAVQPWLFRGDHIVLDALSTLERMQAPKSTFLIFLLRLPGNRVDTADDDLDGKWFA